MTSSLQVSLRHVSLDTFDTLSSSWLSRWVRLQLGTNGLGPAYFTLPLVPELEGGARSSSDGKAGVVNTTSILVYSPSAPRIRWDALRDGLQRKAMGGHWNLYNQSKSVSCPVPFWRALLLTYY